MTNLCRQWARYWAITAAVALFFSKASFPQTAQPSSSPWTTSSLVMIWISVGGKTTTIPGALIGPNQVVTYDRSGSPLAEQENMTAIFTVSGRSGDLTTSYQVKSEAKFKARAPDGLVWLAASTEKVSPFHQTGSQMPQPREEVSLLWPSINQKGGAIPKRASGVIEKHGNEFVIETNLLASQQDEIGYGAPVLNGNGEVMGVVCPCRQSQERVCLASVVRHRSQSKTPRSE
ncbi:MAG: hypothetical protein ACLPHP_06250 [Candidatus Sulfotelmatobacter sp.]